MNTGPMPPTSPAKCRVCDRPMNTPLVCDGCHRLYPAEGLNHFELFGLAPCFDLDLGLLRQRYLHVCRRTHPDQQAGGDPSRALLLSAQLNEAFRVLSDPQLRADYLLELCGGPSAAADKAVSPEVLSATLRLREEIADAKAGGDAAALERCRAEVQRRVAEALEQAAADARRLPGSAEDRARLRATLNALKYYQRLRAEL